MRLSVIAFAAMLVCASASLAQTGAAPPIAAPAQVADRTSVTALAPGAIIIPAGTEIEVELVDALGSARNHNGDLFTLRLAQPILFDGRVAVAAGVVGGGEVVDARPSGIGGQQGRLIVAGRYLDIGGQRVAIRGLRMGGVGADRVQASMAVSVAVGIAGMFVQGGDVELPAGLRGLVRLTAPLELRAADLPIQPQEAALPSTQSPSRAGDTSQMGGP